MFPNRRKLMTLVTFTFLIGILLTISNLNFPSNTNVDIYRLKLQQIAAQNHRQSSSSSLLSSSKNKTSENIVKKFETKLNRHYPVIKISSNFIKKEDEKKAINAHPPLSSSSLSSSSSSQILEKKNAAGVASIPVSPVSSSLSSFSSLPSSISSSSSSILLGTELDKELDQVNISDKYADPRRQNEKSVTFTAEQLKLTQTFKIGKENFCDTDHGAARDLFVFVFSAPGNLAARDAIRKTWGKFAVERGALLIFLLARTNNNTVQAAIENEERVNEDILQANFLDDYFNLTLKTLTMLHWVNNNCNKVKYLAKIDDDMFINMQSLIDFCETQTYKRAIIGRKARKWPPIRNKTSKYFMPTSYFNGSKFPDFTTGPLYLISGDAIAELLNESNKIKPMYLEDVYVTGLLAERAKIRRLNYNRIKNIHVNKAECDYPRFISSHAHSPNDLIKLWNLVYFDTINKKCPTTSSRKPSVHGKNTKT